MADDHIRYDILTQDALRGVVRKVLQEVARTGLPGEHHFFITFGTHAPGVRVSSRLLERYPEDMTIVLQHQYWDLAVTEQALEVGLSFNGIPERLHIPFTAIKAFLDPSVQFGVQFELAPSPGGIRVVADDEEADDDVSSFDAESEEVSGKVEAPASVPSIAAKATEAEQEDGATDDEEASPPAAQVVSLDAFRKKS